MGVIALRTNIQEVRRVSHHIAGRAVEGSDRFLSVAPGTGKAFASVPTADESVMDLAVLASVHARPIWRGVTIEERAGVLLEAARRIRAMYGREGEPTPLKQDLMQEVGKRLLEADVEVAESADVLEFFGTEGPRILGDRRLGLDRSLWPTKKSVVCREPVGVTAAIKPWNYPVELPIWAIASALIAGNTVVFKPSEHSSVSGMRIAEIFTDSGLPPGVLNVIHGPGEVGRRLVRDSRVDMVAFTGSVKVGQEIAMQCARRLIPCTLELGGNDAAIVCADADLELATNGLLWGSFTNAGQVCVRPKRVFVHESLAAEFIDLVSKKADGLRPGEDYGPLISEEQLVRVSDAVDQSIGLGAELLHGGHRLAEMPGFFYEPTILRAVTPTMPLSQEECFGPVMPVTSVPSDEVAILLANDSRFGLGASVWSEDRDKARIIAAQLDVGMVWINDVNVAFPQAPWGGRKMSGHGVELGEEGILEFTHIKHISIEESDEPTRDWWFPY